MWQNILVHGIDGIVLVLLIRLDDQKMVTTLEALERHMCSRGCERNPMKIKGLTISDVFRAGFLNGGTINILGQKILCCGELSSIPGL